jgi:hypothetical protein
LFESSKEKEATIKNRKVSFILANTLKEREREKEEEEDKDDDAFVRFQVFFFFQIKRFALWQ